MAFPPVAATNSGSQTANSTTHTINLPTGIAAGNLLLVFFSNDGLATASVTTPASGWTELGTQLMLSDSARLTVFYRVADGAEGSTITITTSATEQSTHVSYRITGQHASTVPEFASFTPGSSTSNPDPPSLNPSGWDVEDTLWIAVAAWDNNLDRDGTGYPTNYSSNQIWVDGGTGNAPIMVATRNNAAASEDPGTFTISGNEQWGAATIAVRPAAGAGSYTLTLDSGSLSLTGNAAAIKAGRKITADVGSYAQTGNAVTLRHGYRIVAESGAYSLTGNAAGLRAARLLPLASGAYSLNGSALTLQGAHKLTADSGVYALTGNVVVLKAARRLSLDSGSYTLTGNAANLRVARLLIAAVGSYTLTGNSINLTFGGGGLNHYTMTADSGMFVLTGNNAALLASRLLAAVSGNYVLTGNAAALKVGYLLTAAPGAYILTGQDVGLRAARRLLANVGVYVLTGTNLTLNYSGELAPVADVELHLYARDLNLSLDARDTALDLYIRARTLEEA